MSKPLPPTTKTDDEPIVGGEVKEPREMTVTSPGAAAAARLIQLPGSFLGGYEVTSRESLV